MHLWQKFVFLCHQEKLRGFTGAICQTLLLLPSQRHLFLLIYIHKSLWGNSSPVEPFYVWNSSSRIFVNLDVPRWCMEVEQAIVNFCTDCVIKFPLFTCQFWKQIFAFPWWIGIFLLCWSLFCLCFSLCDFIWINAAIDWRHEIESTGFPLPFCFYE